MKLLFVPEARGGAPSGRQVLWTWILWLPVTAACFYVAWGYASSGAGGDLLYRLAELSLALVGLAALGRATLKTRRWLRNGL